LEIVAQRTEVTHRQRQILKALKLGEPARFYDFTATSGTSRRLRDGDPTGTDAQATKLRRAAIASLRRRETTARPARAP